ncbi:MAG: DUF1924 domain-containing protein [Methylotenera sp.]|uniref:DUF1924 domain-containing protein n=1 Tax=Methylotenera sp. TaxID=2051956 RepID=UPI0024899FF1|nr:DUF1924 domain-containing protein [Methylotenera sp.]MDI1308970.1 DUF1924 domain-containing protein [Methylotenera sp.]
MKKLSILLIAMLGFSAISAHASIANAKKLVLIYHTQAIAENKDFAGPSAEEGKAFFNNKVKTVDGKETACASCHTANPADKGKNIVTGKAIQPLSPAVNTKRFSDFDKVEAKFSQHCFDILGEDCTAAQKANYITYVLTEKTPTPKAKK